MKLAFGCGHIDYHDKGYKNIGIRNFPYVDYVTDVSKKLPLEDNVAEEIFAESILEHIPHGFFEGGTSYSRAHLNTIKVLTEWCRALKKGGKCIVKVPNILGIINCYLEKNMKYRDFWMYIYGGQEYKENTHYIGFDPFTLKEVIELAGFRDVVIRNAHIYEQPLAEKYAWEMAGIGIK